MAPSTYVEERENEKALQTTAKAEINKNSQIIILALNQPNPDVKKAKEGMTELHNLLDKMNFSTQKRNELETRILTDISKQIYEERNRILLFEIAAQTSFSTSSIRAASSFNDRINSGMATASLAASNVQFGQELLAMIMDYVKNETDSEVKNILEDRSERLEEMNLGNEERGS